MKMLLILALFVGTFYSQIISLRNLELKGLRDSELAYHNFYRGKHGCPPLAFNSTLNAIAQNYS